MEAIVEIYVFLAANKVVILGALLAVSEALALSPLKSNSVFQLVVAGLKKLAGK